MNEKEITHAKIKEIVTISPCPSFGGKIAHRDWGKLYEGGVVIARLHSSRIGSHSLYST